VYGDSRAFEVYVAAIELEGVMLTSTHEMVTVKVLVLVVTVPCVSVIFQVITNT
jgi:hypothetical protein